jgi:DNA-binding transcriptional MerR regulator
MPKPPQRVRVEMPAEIAPHPVPDAAFETATAVSEVENNSNGETAVASNKIHVSHPKRMATLVKEPKASETETEVLPDVVNVPADEELFKRQYYTIGEVADMFGANQSQIRFWENEFDILEPKKNKKGDRHFRPEDVKNLVLIHHLLRQRRFTIEGAKEYLKRKQKRLTDTHQAVQSLEKIKGFLLEMKAGLAEGQGWFLVK